MIAWDGLIVVVLLIIVYEGEFLVCAVEIDNFQNPNKEQKIFEFNMTPNDGVLFIPKNYANGAMNLSENNSIRYSSSLPLNESINDDYRFDLQFWDPWSKFNPNLYE